MNKNMNIKSKLDKIKKIQDEFPKGTRVVLTEKTGDKGDFGTVLSVDADGIVNIEWDDNTETNYLYNAKFPIFKKYNEAKERSKVKQRLFIDMDGTLAEFRKVDELEALYEKNYFATLNPNTNVVKAVKEILQNHNEIEVFILSSVLSDSKYALREKNEWLDNQFGVGTFDEAHRIFPPCGEQKKDYIPNGIRETDVLLDDYSKNLHEWQPPAMGIKLLNAINGNRNDARMDDGSHKRWKDRAIDYQNNYRELAEKIVKSMQGEVIIDRIEKENGGGLKAYCEEQRNRRE